MRLRVVVWAVLGLSLAACHSLGLLAPVEKSLTEVWRPNPAYLPDAPEFKGPRISETDIPTEPPFVGEGGEDAHGYPLKRPDKIALLNLLRLRRFAELDRFMTFYQDQFEADFRKENWPDAAEDAFSLTDPTVEPLLDEWIETAPESFAPWVARANYRFKLGWHYRGGKFAGATSRAQFQTMRDHFTRATQDFDKALALRPGLVSARTDLLSLASSAGATDAELQALLEAATSLCSLCFEPRALYMYNLTPRWGGSHAAMGEFAEEVAPLFPQNSKLELLEGYVAWDDCRKKRERKQYEEAHRACDLALRAGDSPLFLREKAHVFRLEERHSDRLPILDRALRLEPQDPKALKSRYFARIKTGDVLGAARDFVPVRHLTPADEELAGNIEHMVAALRYEGQELRKRGMHDEAAKYFTVGLQLAPDDKDLIHRQAWNQKLAGVEALVREVAAHPDDFDLRLRLDYGLAGSKRFGEVVTLWDEFIARHPADPRPYRERGGAKWHLQQHDAAIADMQKACDLGMKVACQDAASMQGRARS